MIPEIKKILFVTDLSQSSRMAFYYAASIAHFYKSKIDIMHAMKDIPEGMKSYISTFLGENLTKKFDEKRAESARSVLINKKDDAQMVQKALEVLSEDSKAQFNEERFSIEQIIVKEKEGDILHETSKRCQEDKYDMVISSNKCFKDIEVGSTIVYTVENTGVPLLLVPSHEEE